MTKAAVIASALELSPTERLELLEELWDSIAEDPNDVPLTDEMRAELDGRLAEHEADPSDVIPWEQVKREITGQ
jgi:putative addiction module component (TIGR02574 family)